MSTTTPRPEQRATAGRTWIAPDLGTLVPWPFRPDQHGLFYAVAAWPPLLGTLAGFIYAAKYGLVTGTLGIAFWWTVFSGPAITIGFHRLFTHRSFTTTPLVRGLLIIFGSMMAQYYLLMWVAVHRRHHRCSDHDGDPHSPNLDPRHRAQRWRALLNIHSNWAYRPSLNEELLKEIPDLLADPLVLRLQRWWLAWVALGIALPTLTLYLVHGTLHAAMCGFLWGGLIRIYAVAHTTSLVNSVCHIWGSRPFAVDDESRNNRLAAFVSMGEGWHNNHHAFPKSARHGLKAGEFDLSWQIIRLMEKCGLAWNVRTPTAKQIEAKRREPQCE